LKKELSKMVTAESIMVKSPPVLPLETSVSAAMESLALRSEGFIAVSSGPSRFHGVLTRANVIPIFLKSRSSTEKNLLVHHREFLEPIQLALRMEKMDSLVKKIMTSEGQRLFVINEQDEVLGYITVSEILPYLVFGSNSATSNSSKLIDQPDKDYSQTLEQIAELLPNLYLYENFFQKSPFMMHSIAPNGVIQMGNDVLHRALGYEYGELIGESVFKIYPTKNHEKVIQSMDLMFTQGKKHIINAEMATKTGSLVEVEMISRAVKDQNQKLIGTLTISRPTQMNLFLDLLGIV
jgi:PAS domain S-box-containing protein